MLISDLLTWIYRCTSDICTSTLNKLTLLQKMESEYIFKQLEEITLKCNFQQKVKANSNAVLTREQAQLLLDLLASRWSRIQGTNSSYTNNSDIPANKICIDIAKGLAKILNQPYFEILMPGLQGIANPVVIQQYTNDSNICEFVMTDDNTMLIHIDSAFEQFQCTGTMTNSNHIALSQSEKNAVINHTRTTKKYYDLLAEKNTIKTHANTLGYELAQLIVSLELCGMNNDKQSEFGAIEFIKHEFSNVLSVLSDSQLGMLFGSFFYDDNQQQISFKYLWNQILDADIQEIEIAKITSQLQKLLDNNFILYLASNNPGEIIEPTIQSDNDQYEQIKTNYKNEIQKKHDVLQAPHARQDELKFVTSILSNELGVMLYCSKKAVFKFLLQLNLEDKKQCFNSLLKYEIGTAWLKKSIKQLTVTEQNTINSLINGLTLQPVNPLISKKSVIYIDCEESEESHIEIKPVNTVSDKSEKKEVITQGKKRTAEKDQEILHPRITKKSKKNNSHTVALNIENSQNKQEEDLPSVHPDNHVDDESDIEEQFELTQSQIDEELNAPVMATVFESNDMIAEDQKPTKKKAIKKTGHKSESSSSSLNEKEIHKIYNTAKKKLKSIRETYNQDETSAQLTYKQDNKLSLNAENKAAHAVKKHIKPSSSIIIKYYRDLATFEDLLQAVKITIEFINDYPVKRNIFESEMEDIQQCLNICDSIISNPQKNSASYKQEAKDLKGIIQNKHIPIINYNFAIFNHRKIAIKAAGINENNHDDLTGLIKSLKFDIRYLKRSMAIYEELGDEFHIQHIITNIKKCIAKSYEDRGDYQNNLLDIQCADIDNTEHTIELLENIKSDYQNSFEFHNNDTVWLSIATCQYKLIEIYLSQENMDKAITELDSLIQTISGKTLSLDDMQAEDETQNKLETISTMLYACNKAFSLTENNKYQIIAKGYLVKNKLLLTNSSNTEIIGYIKALFPIQCEQLITIEDIMFRLCHDAELLEKSTDNIDDNIDMAISENIFIAEIATNSMTANQEPGCSYSDDSNIVADIHTTTECTLHDSTVVQQTETATVSRFSFFTPQQNQQQSAPVQKPSSVMEQQPLIANNYQYTPKDIEHILTARTSALPNTYVMSTAQLYSLLQERSIATILQQFINEQLGHLNTNQDRTLLLPIQNASNWCGLIVMMKGRDIIDLTYFNPINSLTNTMQMAAIKKQLVERNLISTTINIRHKESALNQYNSPHSSLLLIDHCNCILNNQNYEVLTTMEIHQKNLEALKSHNPEYYEIFLRNLSSGSVETLQQKIFSRLHQQNNFFSTGNSQTHTTENTGVEYRKF